MERKSSRTTAIVIALVILGIAAAVLTAVLLLSDADSSEAVDKGSPSANLEQARQWIRVGAYEAAEETLENVLAADAEPEITAEAIYLRGYVAHFRPTDTDPERASQMYRKILQDYPDTPSAPFARFYLGRLADLPDKENQRDIETAREHYRAMMQTWPEHVHTDEAVTRLALTYIENIGDVEQEETGRKILIDRLKEYPNNLHAATMHLLLANLARRRENWEEYVHQFKAADKAGIALRSEKAKAYYQLGLVLENELEEYEDAAYWYGRIVYEIKRDARYYVAKLAMQRCLERAGKSGTTQPAPKPTTNPSTQEKGQ